MLSEVVHLYCVPLQAARQQSADAAFNAAAFVERLWSERLLKSADQATDAVVLLAETKRDRKAARETGVAAAPRFLETVLECLTSIGVRSDQITRESYG